MKAYKYILVLVAPFLTYCAHQPQRAPQGSAMATEAIDNIHIRSQADYHFLKAELISRDDPEAAIKEFKEALIYDPNSVDLRLRLAGEYLRSGLVSEAVDHAEEAKKIDPESKEARLILAGLYTSTKLHKKALAEYNYLIDKDFHNEDIITYRAVLYAEMGSPNRSINEFRKLSKTAKAPGKAYYYMGRVYLEFFENKEHLAVKSFKKSLAADPSNVQAVTDLVQIYKAQNKLDRAKKILESHYETYGPSLQTSKVLAQMYLSENNFKQAVEHLEVIGRRDSEDQNNILRLALSLIEMKDYQSAVLKLEELLQKNPGNEKLLFYLGSVNEEMGQDSVALAHFKKIKRESSLYTQALLHKVYITKRLQGFESSLGILDSELALKANLQISLIKASFLEENDRASEALAYIKTLEGASESAQLNYMQGALLDKLNEKERAIEKFKEVLVKDKSHVQTLNHLAYIYAEKKIKLSEAEKLAFRANNLKPKDPHILDTIGYIHLLQGKIKSAARYLEIAHELLPTESIIAEHLGDAYNKLRKPGKAKALYIKAVGLAKDEKAVSVIKTKIERINSANRLPASVAKP